jgi:hypothetical protein
VGLGEDMPVGSLSVGVFPFRGCIGTRSRLYLRNSYSSR